MTTRLLLLALLAGCNQILGLRQTGEVDARFFDAQPDAPYKCPALGTPPAFSRAVAQHVFQDADGFAPTASGHVLARCNDFTSGPSSPICEGPLEGPLVPSVGLPTLQTFEGYLSGPRPSPDGERLIVRYDDVGTATWTFWYFARNTDGSWRRLADPPFGYVQDVGTFAMGATGYIAIVIAIDGTIHEWVDENDQWRELRQHPSFSVPAVLSVTMTWDGLRAIVSRNVGAPLYIDRPDLDSPFGAPVAFEGAPFATDVYMRADCSGIYMSGLGYVFSAQQR